MLKEFLFSLIRHYGGVAIFIGLILEYLGLPIPGETMMSFLGFLGWRSTGSFIYLSLIFAISGTFVGSTIAWFIGYKYGENVLLKYGRYVHITKERLDSTKRLLIKHKRLLLLLGRYVPGVRHIVPYLSGISRIKLGTYLAYNFAGSVIWCISFIGLGFVLGEKWRIVEKLIKAYSLILILLAVFIFVVLKYFSRHKKVIFAITFPLLLFIKLSEDLIRKELSVFDNTIYGFVSKFISKGSTGFMKFISFLGSGQFLIAVAVVSVFALWKNKKYSFYGKMVAVNLLVSSILNETFKIIFHRVRPDELRLIEISGFSFPSGHSMVGISFYGFIAYLFYRNMKSRWKYFIVTMLSVLILLIGLSRIYLGVHYASDVLAGFSAGLAWLAVFITLINRIYLIKRKSIDGK